MPDCLSPPARVINNSLLLPWFVVHGVLLRMSTPVLGAAPNGRFGRCDADPLFPLPHIRFWSTLSDAEDRLQYMMPLLEGLPRGWHEPDEAAVNTTELRRGRRRGSLLWV